MWIHRARCGYLGLYVNTQGHVWIHIATGFMRIYKCTCGYKGLHVDTQDYVWIQRDTCECTGRHTGYLWPCRLPEDTQVAVDTQVYVGYICGYTGLHVDTQVTCGRLIVIGNSTHKHQL